MERERKIDSSQQIPRPWNVWDSPSEGPWSRDAFVISPAQECTFEQVQSEAQGYFMNARSGTELLRDRLSRLQAKDYSEPVNEADPYTHTQSTIRLLTT